MEIGFDNDKSKVNLQEYSPHTNWRELYHEPKTKEVTVYLTDDQNQTLTPFRIFASVRNQTNRETIQYDSMYDENKLVLTLNYGCTYEVRVTNFANHQIPFHPSFTIILSEDGEVTTSSLVRANDRWNYQVEVQDRNTYARFDSSTNKLEFLKSNDEYSNGQVVGNYTYYTDILDLHTDTTYPPEMVIPWRSKLSQITSVDFLDNIEPRSISYWFYNASRLTQFSHMNRLDTSLTTGMRSVFEGCGVVSNIDLSNFNTQYVISMERMFCGCSYLVSLDLSSFNTSNVQSMKQMFKDCGQITSITLGSSFTLTQVVSTYEMFYYCQNLTSLTWSRLTNSEVLKNMQGMFSGCKELQNFDLSNIVVTNVENMSSLFKGCSAARFITLTSFNTSKVRYMDGMFENCNDIESLDLSKFNIISLINTSNMFRECSQLKTVYASTSWADSSKLVAHTNMFTGCTEIKNWDPNFTDKTCAHYNAAVTETVPGTVTKPPESTYNSVKSSYGTGTDYAHRYGVYDNKYYICCMYDRDTEKGSTSRATIYEWSGSSWVAKASRSYYENSQGYETDTPYPAQIWYTVQSTCISQNYSYAQLPASLGGTAQTVIVTPAGYFTYKAR